MPTSFTSFWLNQSELGLGEDAIAVTWVPHFHDFGLISALLSAVFGNGRLYLLSPLAFLKNPSVWFDVMSRVKATHTAAPGLCLSTGIAPNYGFAACALGFISSEGCDECS